MQGVEAGLLSVSASGVGWQRSGAETLRCGEARGDGQALTDSICLVPSPVATELSWTGTSFLEVKGIYYWGAQETFGLLR